MPQNNQSEEMPSELAMKVTDIILNKKPGWSIELEEALETAHKKAYEAGKQDIFKSKPLPL